MDTFGIEMRPTRGQRGGVRLQPRGTGYREDPRATQSFWQLSWPCGRNQLAQRMGTRVTPMPVPRKRWCQGQWFPRDWTPSWSDQQRAHRPDQLMLEGQGSDPDDGDAGIIPPCGRRGHVSMARGYPAGGKNGPRSYSRRQEAET